jgi:hypothetical protein
MKLSKNLSLAEVVKSQTAVRLGIDNEPTVTHLIALKALAENIFQPLRDHFGVPIAVTSGYRSEELNNAIGGSSRSQHSLGEALDLDGDVFGGVTNAGLFHYIKDHLTFDQLIWEFSGESGPAWVHCSYREGDNRGEVLVAYKDKGRTKYKHYEAHR